MITEFSPEVCEQLNYYVYRLIDPRNGQTFYIGKGKGNRVFQHVKCTIDFYDGANEISDDDPNKFRIIKQIHEEGLEVIHIIQRWGLTSDEAFEVEAALIDCYQGLSNVISGHGTEHGVTNAESLENRLKCKVYDEPNDFKYIIIKVRQWRLNELFKDFPNTYRYEATRSAWKIKKPDVTEYPYVFSVMDGIVKEIYKVSKWHSLNDIKRCEFEGDIASDEIKERFVGKRIPDYYCKRGMASPVLFSKNTLN